MLFCKLLIGHQKWCHSWSLVSGFHLTHGNDDISGSINPPPPRHYFTTGTVFQRMSENLWSGIRHSPTSDEKVNVKVQKPLLSDITRFTINYSKNKGSFQTHCRKKTKNSTSIRKCFIMWTRLGNKILFAQHREEQEKKNQENENILPASRTREMWAMQTAAVFSQCPW